MRIELLAVFTISLFIVSELSTSLFQRAVNKEDMHLSQADSIRVNQNLNNKIIELYA